MMEIAMKSLRTFGLLVLALGLVVLSGCSTYRVKKQEVTVKDAPPPGGWDDFQTSYYPTGS